MLTKDASELSRQIRLREFTALEVTQHSISQIEKLNPLINAVVATRFEQALAEAAQIDDSPPQALAGKPLLGIPILVKDLFDFTPDMPSTFGCRAFRENIVNATSLHVHRLQQAGAIILGKTNTPEFGHKGITDNRLFGPTCCPFDISRNAGGSSGGSAAAVATGIVPMAQGSDAGGSVRIPASWCGVIGFKPTFGRIPITGGFSTFGHHSPFVHIGTLTRSTRDAALMATAMSGYDADDPFCLPNDSLVYSKGLTQDPKLLRVGYSADWGTMAVSDVVLRVMDNFMNHLEKEGYCVHLINKELPISQFELASIWRRQVGILYDRMFASMSKEGADLLEKLNEDLPQQIVDMVNEVRCMSSRQIRLDDTNRTRLWRSVQSMFDNVDILITPTLSVLPVRNEDNGLTLGPEKVNGNSVERTIGWCLTHPINFTGHPAASVPIGLSPCGLPVGCQVIGRKFADNDVICMALGIERIRPWVSDLKAATERLENLAL